MVQAIGHYFIRDRFLKEKQALSQTEENMK
jgi:hypothetical protein